MKFKLVVRQKNEVVTRIMNGRTISEALQNLFYLCSYCDDTGYFFELENANVKELENVPGFKLVTLNEYGILVKDALHLNVTNEVRKEVDEYLGFEQGKQSNEFYEHYYMCLKEGLHYTDADRYACLNTLFGYDIGLHNFLTINNWLNEQDAEIFELFVPYNDWDNEQKFKDDREALENAIKENNLDVKFDNFVGEEVKEYKFF